MPSIVYRDFAGGIDLSRPANIQDANRFRKLTNAYVTPGKAVRKRPGARYVWSWGAGTKGLYPGPAGLTGFYGDGNTDAAIADFEQNAAPFVTTKLRAAGGGAEFGNRIDSIETAFLFAGSVYAVAHTDAGIKHYFADGSADNQITDANCPHGPTAFPAAEKVFAGAADGTVAFSKTDDPTDWTEPSDAGFLPTNRKVRSTPTITALAEFNGQLVVSTSDAVQLWETDPDPSKMSFHKTIAVGQVAGDTAANVGTDLFFLSPSGVRSIVLNAQSANAMDLDVGVPVDRLALEFINAGSGQFLARFFPSLGQFWLIRGDRAIVYSFSRTAKVYAWSEYVFPWAVAGAADYAGAAYLRSDAGDIYRLDAAYPWDDDASLAGTRDPYAWAEEFPESGLVVPQVLIETPFFDFKSPASLKQIHAMDIVCTRNELAEGGAFSITHLFRPETGSELFEAGPIVLDDLPDDSRAGGWIPVGLMAPAIAARIVHEAPETFELSGLVYHFDNTGVV